MAQIIDRPTIGIEPRYLFLERRLNDIFQAIIRKLVAHENIPQEWEVEFYEIIDFLQKRKVLRGQICVLAYDRADFEKYIKDLDKVKNEFYFINDKQQLVGRNFSKIITTVDFNKILDGADLERAARYCLRGPWFTL